MFAQWTYKSQLEPEVLRNTIEQHYDVQPTFRLISRLSDAGIVARSIHPPSNTEHLFFGHKTTSGFALVHNRGKINLTPYQPILRISTEPFATGTKVTVVLKPHKDAQPMSGLFMFFGCVLLILGLLNTTINPFIALCSCLFGLCFIFLPKYRADFGFNRTLHDSKVAWENLPLELEEWNFETTQKQVEPVEQT